MIVKLSNEASYIFKASSVLMQLLLDLRTNYFLELYMHASRKESFLRHLVI